MQIPDLIAALEQEGRRIAELAARTPPSAPVPPCPEWEVRSLVRHLGGVHRWATLYVSEARTEPIDQDLEALVGGWPADADLADWFAQGHRALVEALQQAPDDLECFTFLAAPSPPAMWARRQAHETAIHRLDMEAAAGEVRGFATDLALDGIDELLGAFLTRRGRGPRSPEPRTIAVVPTDAEDRWLLRYDDTRCTTERTAREADLVLGGADLVLGGAASDLYAWLWNRPTLGPVSLDGDADLADAWREQVRIRWS